MGLTRWKRGHRAARWAAGAGSPSSAVPLHSSWRAVTELGGTVSLMPRRCAARLRLPVDVFGLLRPAGVATYDAVDCAQQSGPPGIGSITAVSGGRGLHCIRASPVMRSAAAADATGLIGGGDGHSRSSASPAGLPAGAAFNYIYTPPGLIMAICRSRCLGVRSGTAHWCHLCLVLFCSV